ncbi:MAG: alpha/beta fold hydrolase, partial [Ignavibacteriaceae bacterium]|nr:alpha/beta fold hydrolase [Ignavibacteriaceae bacterium]
SMHLDTNGIDPLYSVFNIKVSPIRGDTANTLRDEFEEEPLELFKGFFDNMEANGYILDDNDNDFNEGENLFCFSYDWRKDNAYNAELLSDFIDSVMSWTGADQVNIVGHSMGGIVAKTFVKLFDESRVKKLVFIGTPHLGAPEVLTVMLTGKLFEWLNNFASNLYFRQLGRNLPSCYQLIPTRSYFDLTLNNGFSSGVEVYSECFQLLDGTYLTYDELIDYLRDYESPLGEDLNDFLLDNSEIFKEDIDSVDFGNVQVFNIVGFNQLTIGLNREVEILPGIIIIEDVRNLNGDYTVPLRSAELINGEIFEHTYYVQGMIHSAIPSSQSTLEILLGAFSDPPITNFPQYSYPPWSYITDVNDDLNVISSFQLSQNYPNPFNPVTKFEYRVPSFSHVTLKLYDILGNEIATLVDEEKSFGVYELTFFAGNLPSGVYFYQLRTDDPSSGSGQGFVETKKMILMK